MVVIHCKGHQKKDNHVNRGNALADKATKSTTAQEISRNDFNTLAHKGE